MTEPTSTDVAELLGRAVEREYQQLGALRSPGGSLVERMRQRSRLRKAEADLEWHEVRDAGRARYVWREGILGFGLPFFISVEVLMVFGRGRLPTTLGEFALFLIAGAVGSVGGGWVAGVLGWANGEASYRNRVLALAPSETPTPNEHVQKPDVAT